MRGWMIVAACTLPFAALAQPDSSTAASAPAAPSSDAAATSAPVASAAPADAVATPVAATAPVAGQGFGSQTRLWLATQTDGTYAVTDERPMPGEVATLVYQRYLKSFTHPIPERYESDSFKTSGGGSGGSSSSP